MPNLPMRERLVKVGANTTREDVLSDPVPADEKWYIKRVAFQNETTAFTAARLVVERLGELFFYDEWPTPNAGVVYNLPDVDMYLGPQERVGISFYGITASDVLDVYLSGLKQVKA